MIPEARWGLLFAGYFAVQLVLRLLIGPALELDEAEALLFSRELAWGYGPQPPLYFWLQWGVFQVTGEGLLGLAVLKALLLAGTPIALFAALRREVPATEAGTAALSLALLPQILWESQRALTHSVLAVLMTALALWAFARAASSGRWRDHALLGAALGLGTLSKFNFALWAAGLLAAAILLPEWRARLRPLRLLASLGVAGAVLAAPAAWIAGNPGLASQSVVKLAIEGAGGVAASLAGTWAFAEAIVSFFALPAVALGVVLWASRRRPSSRSMPPIARLMALGAVLPLLAIWFGVLATGTTEVKDRWLLPVAWMLVPAAVLALEDRLGAKGRRTLGATAAALWLLAMVALPYASLVEPGYRGSDWGPVAARLAALGAPGQPLYVAHVYTAGNLLHQAPDLRPAYVVAPADVPPVPAILVVERDGPIEIDPAIAGRIESIEEIAVPRGRRATLLTLMVLRGS